MNEKLNRQSFTANTDELLDLITEVHNYQELMLHYITSEELFYSLGYIKAITDRAVRNYQRRIILSNETSEHINFLLKAILSGRKVK